MTEEMEYGQIKAFMEQFYDACYTKRDLEQVCHLVSDHVLFVGLSPNEIGHDKAAFRRLLKLQMEEISTPIRYAVKESIQNHVGPGLWVCCSLIGLRVSNQDWGVARYLIRLMVTIHRHQERWQLAAVHVSEATEYKQSHDSLLFTTQTEPHSQPHVIDQRQIGRVMDQLIPGGVVNRLNADGYPLAIANLQYIRMLGYTDFESYYAEYKGLFLNCIHPDDQEKYIYTARFLCSTGKQYESEYRLRTSTGGYLWVHDVSRRAVSAEGAEIIVSIITDISEQIERRHQLEMENGVDFLTKVFNRRGAQDRLDQLDWQNHPFLFFMIDLDHFKRVNDLYGHVIGDQVLKHLAHQLTQVFSGDSIICRLGGDEFSVFLTGEQNPAQIEKKIAEISQAYREYTEQLCPKSCTSLSVGGVYGSGKVPIEELYAKADCNLYHIKNNGKGGILLAPYEP